MKSKAIPLLVLVTATACFGEPRNRDQEEKNAIELWQRAEKMPEGKNPKVDLARQVISGSLKVQRVLPDGIIASGQYGTPQFFKPRNTIVFNGVAGGLYKFQADILVVGYQSTVTDGDLFSSVLYPCGIYNQGSRTLKRYATTLEGAFALMQPLDLNAEIAKLEIEKQKIEARLVELRKQQAVKP